LHFAVVANIYTKVCSLQEWNDELADIAQTYSETCMGRQLNPNRSSQAPSFTIVGQSNRVRIPPPVNNGMRKFTSSRIMA